MRVGASASPTTLLKVMSFVSYFRSKNVFTLQSVSVLTCHTCTASGLDCILMPDLNRVPREFHLAHAQPPSHFLPLLTYITLTVNNMVSQTPVTQSVRWGTQAFQGSALLCPRHWEPRKELQEDGCLSFTLCRLPWYWSPGIPTRARAPASGLPVQHP